MPKPQEKPEETQEARDARLRQHNKVEDKARHQFGPLCLRWITWDNTFFWLLKINLNADPGCERYHQKVNKLDPSAFKVLDAHALAVPSLMKDDKILDERLLEKLEASA